MESLDSFQTERMQARRMRSEHADEMCRLYRDPLVMATLGGVRSDEETRRLLKFNLEHWEKHGFGLWMLYDPANGAFLGRGGLRSWDVEGTPETEISYAIASNCWGRGLATELARACVRIAFEELGKDNVVSFTLPTNKGSRRVMEKVGLTYERDIIHADLPHVLYRLRRS